MEWGENSWRSKNVGNDINMIIIKSGKRHITTTFHCDGGENPWTNVCKIVQKFNSIENEGKGTKGNKKYGLLKHMSNSNAGLIPLL